MKRRRQASAPLAGLFRRSLAARQPGIEPRQNSSPIPQLAVASDPQHDRRPDAKFQLPDRRRLAQFVGLQLQHPGTTPSPGWTEFYCADSRHGSPFLSLLLMQGSIHSLQLVCMVFVEMLVRRKNMLYVTMKLGCYILNHITSWYCFT
jgi:hypothetical protein